MDIVGLLFDRTGRIGRLKYIVTSMLVHVFCMFLYKIYAYFAMYGTLQIALIFMLLLLATNLAIQIVLIIKRLHDFNWSGWTVVALYVLMSLTAFVGNGFEYIGQIAAIVLYIALVTIPGTKGPNRFDIQQVYD